MNNTAKILSQKILDTGKNKLWSAICNSGLKVKYLWSSNNEPSFEFVAPINIEQNELITTGINLVTNADDAMEKLSSSMNQAISGNWQVIFPEDFSLQTFYIIPQITITPSLKNNQEEAMLYMCNEILEGLIVEEELGGSHNGNSGIASFIEFCF